MQDSAIRQPLLEFRHALLDLHKALIDSERAVYETDVGPVQSPHHFFQLLTSDPWFAWLRPVSELIVLMDELLQGDEPVTDERASALVERTRTLLTDGHARFGRKYHDLLQRDPTVLVAHGAVIGRLATVH